MSVETFTGQKAVDKLSFRSAIKLSPRTNWTEMSKGAWLTFCLLVLSTWMGSNAEDAKARSKGTIASDSVGSSASTPQETGSKTRETGTPSSETKAPEGNQELTPYEDDVRHRERQHMEDFLNIKERVYVIKRDFDFGKGVTCESAQRERKIDDKDYWYTLRGRQYKFVNELIAVRVIFRVLKTGIHKEYNAVKYEHGPGQPRKERKLMYISPEKTCAILVEELENGAKGCQLIQPDSAIDNGIPEECNRIYKASCGKKTFQVYEPICRNLPDAPRRRKEL